MNSQVSTISDKISSQVDVDIPAIADDHLLIIAETAEKRIEAVNRIKRLALQVTNVNDWIDQNGKPYLQTSGAEKVARLFGISWRIDEPEFHIEESGYFDYTYKGRFSIGSVSIEAIGTRSSKDGFFRRYQYVKKDGKTEQVLLPPSEIDRGDVKKAAYTNCIGNGITRLLGIRNLTWEDIRSSGIVKEKVTSISYRDNLETNEEKKRETHQMLLALYGKDYGPELEKLSQFTNRDGNVIAGVRSLQNLSKGRLEIVFHKTKKLFEKLEKSEEFVTIQNLLKKLYACGIEGYNESWFKAELGKMGVIKLEELTSKQETEMIAKLSEELNNALALISARK
jgi:hypothetical protein